MTTAPTQPSPPWFTVREVAALTRTSKMTVYRLCQAGALHSVRVGRSIRISRESVRALLASER